MRARSWDLVDGRSNFEQSRRHVPKTHPKINEVYYGLLIREVRGLHTCIQNYSSVITYSGMVKSDLKLTKCLWSED